ncbi:MAG: hypothetical protein ACRDRJ_46440 [Streptosporangiaceae bacterium]
MHTSNQASTISSVPPAIAVRLARRSPRASSTAVASAAAPSAASRPAQASAQWQALVLAGRVTSSSTHQGSRNPPTPSATSRARLAMADDGLLRRAAAD